jgi:hypothetical protein
MKRVGRNTVLRLGETTVNTDQNGNAAFTVNFAVVLLMPIATPTAPLPVNPGRMRH